MEWIITILYLFLLCWVIAKHSFFTNSGLSKKWLIAIFIIKFGAGIALTYIYTHHYKERTEADIFKYFDDSEPIFEALFQNPKDFLQLISGYHTDTDYFFDNYFVKMNNWERAYDSNVYNDSHTIIRLNAIMRIVSFGIFNIHTLLFCMLSFIGSVGLYRAFKDFVTNTNNLWIIGCFLLPSVLIWSSGVLKESILIFALGLLCFLIKKIITSKVSFANVFLLVLTFVLLIFIKFYVLVSLIPALICFLLAKKFIEHTTKIYVIVTSFFIVLAFNTKYLPGNFDFITVLVEKQHDFIRLSEWQHAQSGFELTPLKPNIWSFAKVVPEGIINCIIRPLPWHANSTLYWGAIIENSIFLLAFIAAFYYIVLSKIKHKKIFSSPLHYNLFLFCVLFSIILFSIIGITTPVSGALVRYKIPALPFITLSLLLIFESKKKYVK